MFLFEGLLLVFYYPVLTTKNLSASMTKDIESSGPGALNAKSPETLTFGLCRRLAILTSIPCNGLSGNSRHFLTDTIK